MGKTLVVLAIIYFVFRIGSSLYNTFVKPMAATGNGPMNRPGNTHTTTNNSSTTSNESPGFEGGEYIDYEEVKED